MGKKYTTARGKSLDMAGLIARHEQTRAVSNKPGVNARGDEIDSAGRVVKGSNQRVADAYADQVGATNAQAQNPNISPSANPNAPLSPKQLRELEALKNKQVPQIEEKATPLLDKLVEEVNTPVTEEVYVAPIEAEIAPIPPVEPEEFVMKSADEAPDSFGAEGELHPEEAELAELEEDFDIEAIKKAALDNIISEPTPQSTAIESKKKGKK